MFSYYGSKSKVVDYYPPPKYGKIIEPFAGSARYSLKYFDRDITLIDKYDVIVDVWNYLKNAKESDILGLPHMKTGDSIDNYNLSEIERKFMGFIVQSSSGMRRTVSPFIEDTTEGLKNIASQLFKIRNWNIILGDYLDLKNQEATWFIDPPYQFGGHEYKCSNKNINFKELAEWCKSRNGQVVVCENTKADWLPFLPMIEMKGCQFKTTEAIWSNLPTNYDHVQQTINFEK